MAKPLRIFISSPGDVASERRRAALVIEKLAKDYARFFDIKPYLWETEPMLASGHFQDAIVPPGETEILVLILWARLGTPLPEQKYHGIDGRVPVTGTEWEFETALTAHRQSGVPDLLAYKKKAPPKAEYNSDADLDELRRQLRKLDSFWSRYFVGQGEFRAAFSEFEDLDGFEAKLDKDLRRLIERRIATLKGYTNKATAPTWLIGSPFRGLETFRFEHAPIFFGRSEATKSAVEHLVENAELGRPFLLVLGASGAGKSSLAQAGIVPALGVRGVVPSVGTWRRAVMRPGGHPGGPFMALAAALAGDDALPEVLQGQDAAALARHLEAASADPNFPIVSALSAREQAARQNGNLLSCEQVRLILVVDQLEELFTLGEVTPDQRKAFILCLKGLMDSRRVLVSATMRSDYWHRAAEAPLLVALAEGHGRLDLLPPTQAEITEMIRRPAEVAGLSFETDPRTEIGLDAALAEEASREPGALPLLSFLLDALYAKDVEEGAGSTLRYASMRALGGLKGAIATRAEAAFTALPAEAQAALPKVLRALLTVSRSGADPTARAVATTRFAVGTAEWRVVEAFLDPQVRLLVADGDGDGARVRLAHEALITHWERAKRQIAQDRDDLRTRAVVEEALTEWRAADARHKRGYLLRDPNLAAAVDLARRWSGEFDVETLGFVEASRRRARFVQRLLFAAAAVFAIIGTAATALGMIAYRAQQETERARVEVVGQRNRALLNDSRRILARAQQAIVDDPTLAALLSLEGLPGLTASEERPDLQLLEAALYQGLDRMREALVLGNATVSPDGVQIAAPNADGSVIVYDIDTIKPLFALPGHRAPVATIRFSSDSKLIATAYADKTARLWDAQTGKLIAMLGGHTAALESAEFQDENHSLVTVAKDGGVRLWSVPDGKLISAFGGGETAIRDYALNFKAQLVATLSQDLIVHVWNMDGGEEIARFPTGNDESPMVGIKFNDDGRWLLFNSFGTTYQLIWWDVKEKREVGRIADTTGWFLDHHRIISTLPKKMFSTNARSELIDAESGAFILENASTVGSQNAKNEHRTDPQSNHYVTFEANGTTVTLWDGRTRLAELTGHTAPIANVMFLGDRIVTVEQNGKARLWTANTGEFVKEIVLPTNSDKYIDLAQKSPDGRVAVFAGDSEVRSLNLDNGEWAATFDTKLNSNSPPGKLSDIKFSANSQLVAARLGSSSTIRVWNSASGKRVADFQVGKSIQKISFSADSTKLLIVGEGSRVTICDIAARQEPVSFTASPLSELSVAGRAVLVAGRAYQSPAQLWRAESNLNGLFQNHSLSGRANIGVIAGANGSPLILASADAAKALGVEDVTDDKGTVQLIDAASGKVRRSLTVSDGASGGAVASPDAGRVLLLSGPGGGQIFDVATGAIVHEVKFEVPATLRTAVFSPDGKRIALAWQPDDGNDIQIGIWNIDPWQNVATARLGVRYQEKLWPANVDICYIAGGRRLAVSLQAWDKETKVYPVRFSIIDANTAAVIADLNDITVHFRVSNDAKRILSVRNAEQGDDDARLFDGETGRLINRLPNSRRFTTFFFSPDGDRLVTGYFDEIQIRDTTTGSVLQTVKAGVNAASFGRDRKTLVYVNENGIYTLRQGAEAPEMLAPPAASEDYRHVNSLVLSSDGRWIAMPADNRIFVLDAASGNAVAIIAGIPPTEQILFSEDGKLLFAEHAADWSIHRLFPQTEELVAYARSAVPRCLSRAERQQYFLDPLPPAWCIEMHEWPYSTQAWTEWLKAIQTNKKPPLADEPEWKDWVADRKTK